MSRARTGSASGGVHVADEPVDIFLAWRNGTPFGTSDPYFGMDVAFFVFDLPWFRFVVTQVMWTFIISLIAAAAVHFVSGSLRASPLKVSTIIEGQAPEIKLPRGAGVPSPRPIAADG